MRCEVHCNYWHRTVKRVPVIGEVLTVHRYGRRANIEKQSQLSARDVMTHDWLLWYLSRVMIGSHLDHP